MVSAEPAPVKSRILVLYWGMTSFAYIAGDPALDLVNTVDWTPAGPTEERLPDYASLLAWAEGAGVVTPALGERLRREAQRHPHEAREAHARALRVRGLLREAFGATGARQSEAIRALNPMLADALERQRLVAAGRGTRRHQWSWPAMEEHLDSVLWPVLRSTAVLLTSDEADRVRTCSGDDCGWMYVDRSRNGFRRWCQMRTCGTREKTRRRRVGTAD
jgi:predicted RNA-binding Zn ribbon-like protein